MTKTYKLELEIALTDEQQQKVIEVARQLYSSHPASTQEEDGAIRQLPAEEFIDGAANALMSIVDENRIFEQLDIHMSRTSCTDPDYESERADEPEADDGTESLNSRAENGEDDLDAWDEGLYLCRWPNGEFSVVAAATKRDAIIDLDEWAGAEPSWLIPLKTFMVDFRLDDLGRIELNAFGEETGNFIRTHCYPELDAVLTSGALASANEEYSADQRKMIREAVELEKTRLWHLQSGGPDAKTEFGKDLQKIMGTTGTVADHYVELAGTQILKSNAGEGKKPN